MSFLNFADFSFVNSFIIEQEMNFHPIIRHSLRMSRRERYSHPKKPLLILKTIDLTNFNKSVKNDGERKYYLWPLLSLCCWTADLASDMASKGLHHYGNQPPKQAAVDLRYFTKAVSRKRNTDTSYLVLNAIFSNFASTLHRGHTNVQIETHAYVLIFINRTFG